MRRMKNRPAWGFVYPARLHANIPILDQIDSTDTMYPTELVEMRQECRCTHFFAVDRHWVACLVINLDFLWFIRRSLGRDRRLEDFLRGRFPRIFQDPTLIAHMEQIEVHAVGLGLRCRHRNTMPLGIFDQFTPRTEIPLPPGRNDLDFRFQRHVGQLESDLIVPLASGAVGYSLGPFLPGDFDLPSRD